MKHQLLYILVFLFYGIQTSFAQENLNEQSEVPFVSEIGKRSQQVVLITGVRFSYPLIQRWIDEFNKVYPDIQVVIESRGSSDPANYDILVESYNPENVLFKNREIAYLARYIVLPVANSKSDFTRNYVNKGLNKDLINQVYFHDIFSDKMETVKEPYTVYTRLQNAGAPKTFASHYGFEQKEIKGKSIAGSDEHLLKAILRDSLAVSFLPSPLIYNFGEKTVTEGLTVLPIDFNGNGRVTDDEKFYTSPDEVLYRFEQASSKELKNVPMEYLNLSIDRETGSSIAVNFLIWVLENGSEFVNEYGFLKLESEQKLNNPFISFAENRSK
jgi:phosphate transport system substrate-binding protein